jgi:hypothetical protein
MHKSCRYNNIDGRTYGCIHIKGQKPGGAIIDMRPPPLRVLMRIESPVCVSVCVCVCLCVCIHTKIQTYTCYTMCATTSRLQRVHEMGEYAHTHTHKHTKTRGGQAGSWKTDWLVYITCVYVVVCVSCTHHVHTHTMTRTCTCTL